MGVPEGGCHIIIVLQHVAMDVGSNCTGIHKVIPDLGRDGMGVHNIITNLGNNCVSV